MEDTRSEGRGYTSGLAMIVMLVAALLSVSPVHAQKLYKVVDAKGNVTYQDTPPMDESVSVEEKHVDIRHSKLRRDPVKNTRRPKPPSGARRQIENAKPNNFEENPDDYAEDDLEIARDEPELPSFFRKAVDQPAPVDPEVQPAKPTKSGTFGNAATAGTGAQQNQPQPISSEDLADIARGVQR